ncbi:MAG: AAA family ATPase [Dysosmobacter welbionis]
MTMNIKEAKEQIKNAMTAYFTKDEFGSYAVPVEKQRPVFLMGPPGIGKTQIMEQIAQELDVCLVSYSMTHHTRQSALGLPFIEKKVFNGKEYQVSEYTMSEIIASVYETMEATGKKEASSSWTRSTASARRWPLPCCNFCNIKSSAAIGCRRAGSWSLPATRRSTTAPSGSSTSLPGTGSSASTWSRTSMPGRSLPTRSTSIRR